jgi:ABC-type lipoprotein export system ATPase subunit
MPCARRRNSRWGPEVPTLAIENVSQTFGSGESAVQALKPTSLSVEAGELAALLGPSGSGKSTLLLAIRSASSSSSTT